MRINVSVRAMGRLADYAAAMEIPEPLIEAFAPLKTTDEPILALLGDEKMPHDATVQRVIKLRPEAAKEIAEVLTKVLIAAMQQHDTHNGYPKESQ